MKTHFLAWIVLCALLVGGAPVTRAQTDWPPTIFMFTSDVMSVTVEELESGSVETTLHWHVAHTGPTDTIQLHAYRGNEWVPLTDTAETLPSVGEHPQTLEHPGNFGPVTYRLSVLNPAGQMVEQRMLVIPYTNDTDDVPPTVFSFSALDRSVAAAELADGTARVRISWVVHDRSPRTHIMFEQVLGDETVNVELPRAQLYVPSKGAGVVAPVAPPSGSDDLITLRLVVIDVISADVLDEATVTVGVMGTALPPETTPMTAAPTEVPEPEAGALTVLESCTLFPPGVPERGWIDSPGIPSPDGRVVAYVTNSVGDAELVIAQANGSGQFTVPAPNRDLPLWSRPRWSPDGTRIAFNNIAISPPGGGTIYVVNADGTDLRELASYAGYYDDIAWSQDGARLYFTSGDSPEETGEARVTNYRVFSVGTDGLGTPELVTSGCGVLE